MPISQVKKWTAIIVLVGMIMTIGGSIAVAKAGVERNSKQIEANCNLIDDLQASRAYVMVDMASITTDLEWIKATLTEISGRLDN